MYFDGIEVDVLSLGDADCMIVTQWIPGFPPQRILVDGGSGADADTIIDFLRSRGFTSFWAVLCTHLHNDHARGLIKIVQNESITFINGWMHDIRRHIGADALRRASSDDGVKEVVETTRELASAFASRNLTPEEPFTNSRIARCPNAVVLGPSLPYYRQVIEKFTDVNVVRPLSLSAFGYNIASIRGFQSPLSSLLTAPPPSAAKTLTLLPPPEYTPTSILSLVGALSNSNVKENPATQPFNNTSVILGINYNGSKLLLTADAGSEALGYVPAAWNCLLYMGVPHHGSDGNLSQKDIERFCPQFAIVSARGDSNHPSRAIVSGLVKCGSYVCSTHKSGNLRFHSGNVPPRADYFTAEPLRGTGEPQPVINWRP